MILNTSAPIMIVDDIPIIANIYKDIILDLGFQQVSLYDDPYDALTKVEQQEVHPKVVISDLDMPCMNGVQLLDSIKKLIPNITGIIISGDPNKAISLSTNYAVFDKGCDTIDNLISALTELDRNGCLC